MTTTGYPPAHHLLTDLGMEGEVVSPTEVHLRMAVTPHVLGPDGGVRAGVLATVVDVVGGSVALRAAGRQRMATADLVVEMVRPARGPRIEARASLRRRGRTTLVVEAVVFETPDDAAPTAAAAPTPSATSIAPVAWASMTFSLLPERERPKATSRPRSMWYPRCPSDGPSPATGSSDRSSNRSGSR